MARTVRRRVNWASGAAYIKCTLLAFCYLLMEPLSLSPVSVEVLILSDLTHFQALLRICQHLKMKIPVTRLFLGALVLSQRLVLFCRGGISFSIVFFASAYSSSPFAKYEEQLRNSCLGIQHPTPPSSPSSSSSSSSNRIRIRYIALPSLFLALPLGELLRHIIKAETMTPDSSIVTEIRQLSQIGSYWSDF